VSKVFRFGIVFLLKCFISIPESSFESEMKIPDNNSNEVEDEANNDENWIVYKVYDDKQEAFDEIKKQKIWTKLTEYERKTLHPPGTVLIYRCNQVKCRGIQCQSGARLLLHSDSQIATLFFSKKPHNCSEIETKDRFTEEVKSDVRKMMDFNLRPKIIYNEMNARGHDFTLTQIRNLILRLRRKEIGKEFANYGEMAEFLDGHRQVPEARDEGFILDYDFDTTADNQAKFQFIVSTRDLLSLAKYSDIFQSDATYKISLHNFNVLICGHTDRGRRFHPMAVSVSCKETTKDYEFFFKTVKKHFEDEVDEEFLPQQTMRDYDDAIKNAYNAVFPTADDNTCYYHMMKNATDKVSCFFIYFEAAQW
jgi:hypothetical protein